MNARQHMIDAIRSMGARMAATSTGHGVVRMDIDIGAGAGNLQFAGTVATGQVIVLTGVTITMPNA